MRPEPVEETETETETESEEAPPLMGSWTGLYAFVIGFLALQIGLYWALSAWVS